MKKADRFRTLTAFFLPALAAFLSAACRTLSPAEADRTELETLFLIGRDELLARLPEALRRTAVVGENEIEITVAATRPVYNMIVTLKSETVYYRFTGGRLTRIEIITSSEAGALDPDLAELRDGYRTLDRKYRSRLGTPATDTRERNPPEGEKVTVIDLLSADTTWPADVKRDFLPGIEVTLTYRERSIEGAGSIRFREIYEWKDGR
ncbi:MAG: hypothetical protein JXD23_11650 [Spirochaetales bacterium]|nr:hypothetical protein [Spirochaetales bacterium]